MKDIYTRTPVNGTAASVVTQAGCANTDKPTPEEERDNLLAVVAWLRKQLEAMPKTKANAAKRKALGKRISETNLKISELKGKEQVDLTHIIIDVVKEEMTLFQWNRIVEKAEARLEGKRSE